jgi:type III secretion protein Q
MFDLPRYAGAEMPSLAAIFVAGRILDIELCGDPWAFELRFDTAEYQTDICCELTVEGAAVSLFLDDVAGQQLLQRWFPDIEVWALPDPVRAALVDVALGDAVTRLQAATGWSVVVRSLNAGGAPAVAGRRVDFALRDPSGGLGLLGHLVLDDESLARLAGLVARVAPRPDETRCDAVPLLVRIELGWTRLPVASLRALRPRDLIVLDSCAVADDGLLTLRLGPRLGLRGRLEASGFVFHNFASDMMAETEEGVAPTDSGGASPGSLDGLEIKLTFDVGERLMTLGELKATAPGQVFDLGRDVRRAVSIRANGQAIGTGELVQVDDRIAVRVLTLFGGKDG